MNMDMNFRFKAKREYGYGEFNAEVHGGYATLVEVHNNTDAMARLVHTAGTSPVVTLTWVTPSTVELKSTDENIWLKLFARIAGNGNPVTYYSY